MSSPRWLADEMVGRLARYLRFVGYDTEYVRGLPDEEVLRWAVRDDRVLLTRDRALAARAPHAVLLTAVEIRDQWLELRRRFPALRHELAFDRCSECNSPLEIANPTSLDERADGFPWERIRNGLAVYRCPNCHHHYWEGSHSDSIRRTLSEWATGERT